MSQLIISVSGVRGIFGDGLDSQVAERLGRAYASMLGKARRIVLARDSRPSGSALSHSLGGALSQMGSEVIDLDLVTTPGAALMTVQLKADGAVVITASHNPAQWNGLKFLGPDGLGLSAEDMAKLGQIFYDKSFEPKLAERPGSILQDDTTHKVHSGAVLAHIDTETVISRRFRVALDSVNGAGGPGTRMLLEKLGCEVIHINGQPSGQFAHAPEPIAENLGQLCQTVNENRAQVGFAQDPDADRLALVDELGRFIGEEYTLALAVTAVLSKEPGPIATNLSTSRMIDDLAQKFNVPVFRTPVGEAHVARALRDHHCVIGGEGNGGVINPKVVTVRDSFSGIALLLELMARTGKTVSQLIEQMPRYVMLKVKFPCEPDRADEVLDAVAEAFARQGIDRSDGLRIDWPKGWVHVRKSNTEPIMRIFAEAKQESVAREFIRRVTTIAQSIS